jgi:hypothetical protein
MIISGRNRIFRMDILSQDGRHFRVLIGPDAAVGKARRVVGVVEFHDVMHARPTSPDGVPVARFSVPEFLNASAWTNPLTLENDGAEWHIPSGAMLAVREWVDQMMEPYRR